MWIQIFLLIIFLFLIRNFLAKPKNYPPGWWGFPLVGYLPITGGSIENKLRTLKNQHGDITMWRIGTQKIVFLFDFKLIKDALNRNEFADRPPLGIFRFFNDIGNLGLISSNGLPWHTRRRFSLRLLRDLGMGKTRMVAAIQYEASELVKEFKKLEGKSSQVPHSIVVAVVNVLWQIIASRRYNLDHKELHEFEDLITRIQQSIIALVIPDFFPWISYLLPNFVKDSALKRKVGLEARIKMTEFIQKIINEHEQSLDENNPRDYIDFYLLDMKQNKDNSIMSMDDLSETIGDLFRAGSETTSTTLTWAFYYLARYPDIQARLQKEIDGVLPRGTPVAFEDKERLPYTESFLHEIYRHVSLAKLGIFRQATTDVELGGYHIPKGAFLSSVSFCCHRDLRYWDRPNEFCPDRFLDSSGKFVYPKEGFLPFGSGKRQCIGESLARLEIFIFLVTLIQHLSFTAPPGVEINLTPLSYVPLFSLPDETQEIIIKSR